MVKIIHFSDLHAFGGQENPDTSTLEAIVNHSNAKKADHLVFTGDIIDGKGYGKLLSKEEQIILQNIPILIGALRSENPSEFMKNIANVEMTDDKVQEEFQKLFPKYQNIAEKELELSEQAYTTFNQILGKSNANVEILVGNHDIVGMEGIVKNANFEPNEKFGRYFFQTGPPRTIPMDIAYQDSPEEYKKCALEQKPKVMLWHQGPYTAPGFENEDISWTKSLSSKIHLYGHNHVGYHVKYDKETKRLDVNVTSQEGYFAEIDMNDAGEPTNLKIYKIDANNDNKKLNAA